MGQKSDRLHLWLEAGMPDDDESLRKYGIGDKELRTLQKRVMLAIASKMLAAPGRMTFADHRTLQ
jgi:hypothetical protein